MQAVKNLQSVQMRPRKPAFRRAWLSWIGIVSVIALWQIVVWLRVYPEFIIPPPISVVERFWEALADGTLWLHTSTTVSQMLAGLLFGVVSAVILGTLIGKSRALEALLSPLIVAVQSTPVVAYAPLLVIWFGSGPTSKIVTSALIVFFPMLLNTMIGIRSVPVMMHDLMRSLHATRWQTFRMVEVPYALPVLLGGLKVSATLAVIGAVVGEFVMADAGLGRLINQARFSFDTPLVLVAVITLAAIARFMYGMISVLERRLLFWQRRQ